MIGRCATMSKPKFQTEWEEIDEEHQQLQVTRETPPASGPSSPRLVPTEGAVVAVLVRLPLFLFAIHSPVNLENAASS